MLYVVVIIDYPRLAIAVFSLTYDLETGYTLQYFQTFSSVRLENSYKGTEGNKSRSHVPARESHKCNGASIFMINCFPLNLVKKITA